MRTRALVAVTLIITTQMMYGIAASQAADILWEVEKLMGGGEPLSLFQAHLLV